MQRIIFVVHEMNRGGIETLIMNIFRTIDRSKIMFDFVVHVEKECDYDREIQELGGVIYHCPEYRLINHFQYVHWWKRFLTEHPEYRVIHSHFFTVAKIHLAVAKKLGRITIVHSHTGSKGEGFKAVAKSILSHNVVRVSDYLFACSEVAAQYLFKENAEEAVIIKNGIIAKNYIYNEDVRSKIRAQLHIKEDELVIGNVASVNPLKNQKFIIDITKELTDANKKVRFVCLGKSHVGNEYVEYAAQAGVAERVNFVGVQSNVNEWLQAFDVFLMPSLYEGLPVAAVEAQASGLRCLLSDTISSETNISGLVDFKSLEDGASSWAQTILKMIPYERCNTYQIIADAGYDIKTSTEWLTDFYLKLEKEKG